MALRSPSVHPTANPTVSPTEAPTLTLNAPAPAEPGTAVGIELPRCGCDKLRSRSSSLHAQLSRNAPVVAGAAGAACCVILVAVVLLLWCRLHAPKKTKKEEDIHMQVATETAIGFDAGTHGVGSWSRRAEAS